jgi:ubiquinone/menaquinone biosynthesis C-methylase UbiE
MGFYDRWVLPRLLNLIMSDKAMCAEREKVLGGVSGTVLEVGFGTGMNLPYYPQGVQRLVAVDPSRESARLAQTQKRIAAAPFPVEYLPIAGEQIQAPDHSFDSVVSTFTLCSIADPLAALEQMRRVLKPGGKLFLVEHGLSSEPRVQRWQTRLNRIQNFMCGGCHLNRDVRRMITEAGFAFDQVDQHYIKGPPKFAAFVTRGVASAAA